MGEKNPMICLHPSVAGRLASDNHARQGLSMHVIILDLSGATR